jgi:alkanesulfonate monooxygenase SsuD/methylene tetrahydromethanopterin reductase-like flavin-dependent oxidoreductase (luciferase family)
VLSEGRVVAGVGPGSSERDYDAVGVPFDERWGRFEESVKRLRELLGPESPLSPAPARAGGVPIWLASWGSRAGMRRVARLGDGWFASAYNTAPEAFATARESLPAGFPNALVTMWTWITPSAKDADRVLREVLGPLLRRDPETLRGQLCVGSPQQCAELLSRYAEAGCERVHLWPLGAEARQVELAATAVG